MGGAAKLRRISAGYFDIAETEKYKKAAPVVYGAACNVVPALMPAQLF